MSVQKIRKSAGVSKPLDDYDRGRDSKGRDGKGRSLDIARWNEPRPRPRLLLSLLVNAPY
jgi:hypothetical protein